MAGFYVKILFCTLALGKFSILLNARRWHLIVKKYLIFACFLVLQVNGNVLDMDGS